MALTFTGTNERRLTKQKKYSFLLENCSVNNLTGSADFGFKDSSNEIKFNFNQGNIFDFDDRNCFSYVKDEKFSISGDISLMLKNSKGFEHLMPNFNSWTKLV